MAFSALGYATHGMISRGLSALAYSTHGLLGGTRASQVSASSYEGKVIGAYEGKVIGAYEGKVIGAYEGKIKKE